MKQTSKLSISLLSILEINSLKESLKLSLIINFNQSLLSKNLDKISSSFLISELSNLLMRFSCILLLIISFLVNASAFFSDLNSANNQFTYFHQFFVTIIHVLSATEISSFFETTIINLTFLVNKQKFKLEKKKNEKNKKKQIDEKKKNENSNSTSISNTSFRSRLNATFFFDLLWIWFAETKEQIFKYWHLCRVCNSVSENAQLR